MAEEERLGGGEGEATKFSDLESKAAGQTCKAVSIFYLTPSLKREDL